MLFKSKKTGKIWASMKNVRNGLGFKDMSDLILKETYGKYETKSLTNEQIKKYKISEREILWKVSSFKRRWIKHKK